MKFIFQHIIIRKALLLVICVICAPFVKAQERTNQVNGLETFFNETRTYKNQNKINLALESLDKAAALAEETLERWFTPPYLAEGPPGVRRIRDMILSTPVSGFIGCSEAIRRLDFLDRLGDIRLPTLIIVGEQDPGTPVANSEAIHNRIKDSRLEIIASAAHLCNVEQSEVFNQTLIGFLQTL